jgi:hypothetical protein
MIDLKKTKAQLKEERNQQITASPSIDGGDQYPWGTSLRFEKYAIDKIDALKKGNAGDMVKIVAFGKIVEVRTTDSSSDRKHHSVEIQIQKIDIKGQEKDMPEDENDAFND